ncbi:MAG: hypothetical protein SPE67_01110 [Dialister sp.]|nr:hypothetical protein [Dialister sp.]
MKVVKCIFCRRSVTPFCPGRHTVFILYQSFAKMPKKFDDRLKIASAGTKGSTGSQDETSKTPQGFDRKDIKPFDAANA